MILRTDGLSFKHIDPENPETHLGEHNYLMTISCYNRGRPDLYLLTSLPLCRVRGRATVYTLQTGVSTKITRRNGEPHTESDQNTESDYHTERD